MTIELLAFALSIIAYVVLAVANVEALRAPADGRTCSPRRSPIPPSRD
jgi:hypothetical protein